MIEVSENLRSLINEDSRTFRVKLVKETETYEEIRSLKKSVLFPNSSMSIGNALSACIECTAIDVPVSITGAEIEVQITILDSEEWIRLGKFTVEKPTVQDGNVSFLAYDKMAYASDKKYTSTLTEGEHTAQEYFSNICSVLGAEYVALPEEMGSLLIAEDKLSGYSCRDALAYLAGFIGRNCIVNCDGLFEMIGFTTVNYGMLNVDRVAEPELSDTECNIGYIACCVDNETTLHTGTGSNGFEFISPIMTQERLDSIGVDMFDADSVIKVYKAGKIKQLLGDPTLEIGDVIPLEFGENIYTVPIMSLVLDYDGGLQAEVESFELTEPSSLSLGERVNFQQKQAKESTDAYIKAIIEFSEAIQQAYGVNSTEINGIVYFHDAESITEAEYIFCMTTKGFAIASGKNCWGGSHESTIWKYGIDKEGSAVLNMLNVFHINANNIRAGTLQSTNGKTRFDLDNAVFRSESEAAYNREFVFELRSGGQSFAVKDAEGNEIGTGSFSARGMSFEQSAPLYEEEQYIAKRKAEWEEKNSPVTWEEYSSSYPDAAKLLLFTWRTAHAVLGSLLAISMKSTIPGREGEIIITPEGITFGDGSKVLTNAPDSTANKVLWRGGIYMYSEQIATLSEAISKQLHGIVLVWSRFDITNKIPLDENFILKFIPKSQVKYFEGCDVIISEPYYAVNKRVWVFDTYIKGDTVNNSYNTVNGIYYYNSNYVLRQVIGV